MSACHAAPRPTLAPGASPAGGAARLRHEIDLILDDGALERSQWAIVVNSLDTGETLYGFNGRKLLMPGSTMKIVTLAVAAERLGWDYTFETRVVATGPIRSGVLDGDLVIVGSGDPSITDAEGSNIFGALAEALKSQGLHAISGRIVGDDNVFDDEAFGPGWAWDDLAGRDSVAIGGLQYNENTVEAIVTAGPSVGSAASVTFAPVSGKVAFDNRVTTISGGATPMLTVRRSPVRGRLEFAGSVAVGSAPLVRVVSVDNPTLFFAAALREKLIAEGIRVDGDTVDVDDLGQWPSSNPGTVLWSHRSPPLAVLAMRLMKNSQNLYAESLFKAMGRLAGSATFEGGRTISSQTVWPWGVSPTGLIQVDGSGLSRYNYLTADTLVTLLTHVEKDDRLRGPFESSLPIAGRDGTLAARMRGTAAEGNATAKSGTLANVRSLAGYVTSTDGERLVFAIIANNYGTMPEVAVAAIDAIVVKLAEFAR